MRNRSGIQLIQLLKDQSLTNLFDYLLVSFNERPSTNKLNRAKFNFVAEQVGAALDVALNVAVAVVVDDVVVGEMQFALGRN